MPSEILTPDVSPCRLAEAAATDVIRSLFPRDDTRPSWQFPGTALPISDCELTGSAAFSAAVAAGVPVETRIERGMLVMRLTHPVAVFLEGGLIKVFTLPNE